MGQTQQQVVEVYFFAKMVHSPKNAHLWYPDYCPPKYPFLYFFKCILTLKVTLR